MGIVIKMGNHYEGYSDEEWDEMNEQAEAEAAEAEAIEIKLDGMEAYLRRQLKEIGFLSASVSGIARIFRDFTYPISDAQFPDAKKKIAVDALWQRWDKAASKFY